MSPTTATPSFPSVSVVGHGGGDEERGGGGGLEEAVTHGVTNRQIIKS